VWAPAIRPVMLLIFFKGLKEITVTLVLAQTINCVEFETPFCTS
jgi:hypothetical protein